MEENAQTNVTTEQPAPQPLAGGPLQSEQMPPQTQAVQEHANVTNYVDGYCERAGNPAATAEPLNLFTNFAFIIAALLIALMMKKYRLFKVQNLDIILLDVVMFTIGIGSGIFHSIPNSHTVLMDVIPIGIFIHLYIVVFFKRVVNWNLVVSILVLLAFIGAGIWFQKNFSAETLNGTIMYVPTYLMLIIMVFILCFVKQNMLYVYLINTAVIWTFSLAFRTIDMQICGYTHGIGTHFMWHVLNAIVLYRMLALVVGDKIVKMQAQQQQQQ